MFPDTRKQATFIGGCPRSGTTLITALLDDHPELSIFPEEYLYLTPAGDVDREADLRLETLFKEKVLRRLQGEKGFLDRLHGRQRQYAGFDYRGLEAGVREAFAGLRGGSPGREIPPRALALLALVEGFRAVAGRAAGGRWVFKHPHYEFHGDELFADFPDARLIWMVRDPRQVVLSRAIKREKKRHLKRGGRLSDWRLEPDRLRPALRYVTEWERSVEQVRRLERLHAGKILKVRYEDLVAGPPSVMGRVAEFLGIRWNEALLTPSFLGVPWEGDSMQGKRFQGTAVFGEPRYRLAPRYRRQIETWLGDVMTAEPGCYPPGAPSSTPLSGGLLAPMRGEGPLAYLRNRRRMWANLRKAPPSR